MRPNAPKLMHGPNGKINFSSSFHNGSRRHKNTTFKVGSLPKTTQHHSNYQYMHKTLDLDPVTYKYQSLKTYISSGGAEKVETNLLHASLLHQMQTLLFKVHKQEG